MRGRQAEPEPVAEAEAVSDGASPRGTDAGASGVAGGQPADAQETEPIPRLEGRRFRLSDLVPARVRSAAASAAEEAQPTPTPTPILTPTPRETVAAEDTPAPQGSWGEVWRAARARRKSLRNEVRRFTARQRRRRIVLWVSLGAVALMLLGTVGVAYSPLFAVERVRVVGAEALNPAVIEEALADQRGTPLALVNESEIKAALVAFPLVESYTLEARPPRELVVRIVERTPVGVIESDAGFTLVDAAGVALSTTEDRPEGVALVEVAGGIDGDAFAAVGAVVRALPAEVRAQVTEISATTPNDVAFTLADSGAEVIWGSADDSAKKALVLDSAMTALPPGEVSVYDVSSPNALVVR